VELDGIRARLAQTSTLLASGRVESVVGLALRVTLAAARVGDVIQIHRRGAPLLAQVVGVEGSQAVAMPLGDLLGVGAGDRVEARGTALEVQVSEELLGRVVNGLGETIDGKGPVRAGVYRAVECSPPSALSRRPVNTALATGVRVIDGLMTLGEGQRIGLFAGSGVGKSMLLGAIARGTTADVVVVALVGERGREVGEFLEKSLGKQGVRRSVVVVATSDAPALERLTAAQVATAVSEHFRDQGAKVMLLVDSVTRFARAQREVGLAAGEPPARRGYPPSVFAMLPRLLERSGQGQRGSITAIYTVLVEGGDMDEPIADEVRGILDGHVVLDRGLASRGRYPAVDVPNSLSRVMASIVGKEHGDAAARLRRALGLYESKRDLIALGAYTKGSDRELDAVLAAMPRIEAFLGQGAEQQTGFDQTVALLQAIRT
jgi:FliI/YscN family ATPase